MAAAREHIVVTGANRGLGLEFVRQYAAAGARMLAACRDPANASELSEVSAASGGLVEIIALDVTDDDAVAGLPGLVERRLGGRVDIMVNNAGASPRGERLGNIVAADMLGVLHVNTVAPLMVLQALRPALEASVNPRVANISSSMGSLSHKDYGRHYSYGASKAGLNMITRAAAHDLAEAGISVVSLHPGWVRTDLGGPKAALSPEESVRGMRAVIDRVTLADSGSFLTWEGEHHAW